VKKIMILALALAFIGGVIWAGPFDLQDEQAKEVAMGVRTILGGEEYEKLILQQNPGAELKWGGRIVPSEEAFEVVCVVYCEVTQPVKEPLYYYWEVKIKSINDNPMLMEKYLGFSEG